MKPCSLVAALVLAGCVGQPPVEPNPGGGVPLWPCGADRLQGHVGQPLAMLPPDRRDVTRRVIWPGDAVTEDFSLQRLNVHLDATGMIVQLSCG